MADARGEGGLEAPRRVPLDWQDAKFYDAEDLDKELRRVFDICHGCRRCFNLCDSFPRLFDAIDATEDGEVDQVKSEQFGPVVEACTLCDMCFMTKCPYVPPHPFNLDFPHLMLRARAIDEKNGKVGFVERQITATDRNGRLAGLVAPLLNWATATSNAFTRGLLAKLAGIHPKALLPKYHARSFVARARANPPARDPAAPAHERKAVIFATCFVNYNNPDIGEAAQAVLARNGVATEVVYPMCCGMPQLEHGDLKDVAARARHVAQAMKPWVDKGYEVIAAVPSCALMLKFEWPLLVPGDADVAALAKATRDISEYVVSIAGKEGLAPGLARIEGEEGGAWLQLSCHARAQNMGAKAAEMLRLIPGFQVGVIERCSGHGGSWGIKGENFEVAMKVGRPVARQVTEAPRGFVASECPLAGDHVVQGAQMLVAETGEGTAPARAWHPIEIFARAYGLLGSRR